MQFGLHLGLRGPAGQPGPLGRLARRAEAAGYGYLGVSDHVVIARNPGTTYPYTKDGRWFAEDTGECLEQVTTVGFLAAATERIRLLTSVMVLGHRPPMLAAKMLATADVLSGGRLTLGVGVGWLQEEFALLPHAPDFASRGAAANETLEAFRTLWTEPAPAYAGQHVAFDNLLFSPKPAQKPHPPIWVGGESPAARRRAGRLGDAWYPLGNHPRWRFDTPARYAAGLAQVRETAEAAGRPAPAGSYLRHVDHAGRNGPGRRGQPPPLHRRGRRHPRRPRGLRRSRPRNPDHRLRKPRRGHLRPPPGSLRRTGVGVGAARPIPCRRGGRSPAGAGPCRAGGGG